MWRQPLVFCMDRLMFYKTAVFCRICAKEPSERSAKERYGCILHVCSSLYGLVSQRRIPYLISARVTTCSSGQGFPHTLPLPLPLTTTPSLLSSSLASVILFLSVRSLSQGGGGPTNLVAPAPFLLLSARSHMYFIPWAWGPTPNEISIIADSRRGFFSPRSDERVHPCRSAP